MIQLAPEDIPRHLRRLRNRSGYSIETLARKMGYKTGSGYERYEQEPRRKPFSLSWLERLAKAVVGRGDPPIEQHEVFVLRERAEAEEKPEHSEPMAIELAAEIALCEFAR